MSSSLSFSRLAIAFAVTVGAASSSFAVPVSGTIAYTGFGGNTSTPGSISLPSAVVLSGSTWTGIDFESASPTNANARFGSASFTGDTAAVFNDVSFGTPGGVLFTSRNSNITFNWTSVTTSYSGNTRGANFEGYFNGDRSNKASLVFSTQDTGASWSAQIPAPALPALLGLGMLAMALVRGRRSV